MKFKQEILIKARPEVIFEHYKNVESWKHWDSEVKESSIHGTFQQGSSGTLTPKKGPKANFILTEVSPSQSFTTLAHLPLCKMAFIHTLEDQGSHTKVTHLVSFNGLSSFIFGKLIGSQIDKSLPDTLQGLKDICE